MSQVHGKLARIARAYRNEMVLLKRRISELEEAERAAQRMCSAESEMLRLDNVTLREEVTRANDRLVAISRIAGSANHDLDVVMRC